MVFQLKPDMSGAEVLAAQHLLIEAGYHATVDGQELIPDSIYGPVMKGTVEVAQSDMQADGIYQDAVDGLFGPNTLVAVLTKVNKSLEDFDAMVEAARAELKEDTSDDADDDYDDIEDELEGEGNEL